MYNFQYFSVKLKDILIFRYEYISLTNSLFPRFIPYLIPIIDIIIIILYIYFYFCYNPDSIKDKRKFWSLFHLVFLLPTKNRRTPELFLQRRYKSSSHIIRQILRLKYFYISHSEKVGKYFFIQNIFNKCFRNLILFPHIKRHSFIFLQLKNYQSGWLIWLTLILI